MVGKRRLRKGDKVMLGGTTKAIVMKSYETFNHEKGTHYRDYAVRITNGTERGKYLFRRRSQIHPRET